jgi:hypothetical protein
MFFEFSYGYVSCFRSYLTNRQFLVRVFGTHSLPFQVSSGVSQGSLLGCFLYNIVINNLCNYINHCTFLISADDIEIFLVINSPHDCLLLQSDINFLTDFCDAKAMRINIAEILLTFLFCHTPERLSVLSRCHCTHRQY